MAEKYTGVEKYIFADVYNFFLKYKDVPNTDYHWTCCIGEAKLLNFKYKDYPLARHMVIDILEQLELKICGKVIGGYTYDQWEQVLGDYANAKPFSANTYNNRL